MDIIGIGYLGLTSPNPDAWRSYAPEVLGMEIAAPVPGDEKSLYLRMDDRRHRIAVHPGKLDQIAYTGWELISRTAYREALQKLAAAGVDVETCDEKFADLRGVREVSRFKDPIGYQHEIFYAQELFPGSFRTGRKYHAGFNCGAAGVGHLVLISPEPLQEVETFFMDVMGFKWFSAGTGKRDSSIFLRSKLNSRSHCIAFGYAPNRFGLQHIALGLNQLDDVGITQDLVMERDMPLQMTLGRHTNDPVISFYHFTPSGFPIECFWEAEPWIEDNFGFEANTPHLSRWGHKIVGPLMGSTVRPIEAASRPK